MSLGRRLCITLISMLVAQGGKAQNDVLPFSCTATERTGHLPEYVSPPGPNLYNNSAGLKVGWGIDSPTGFVVMDGDVWVIFNHGDQYGTTVKVARYRGRDFEHTERQPDGTILVEPGVSTHFCGGLWYDPKEGKLYAPIHCEYERGISPPAGWTRKKTRLATSSDKGLTWRLKGDILTDCMPDRGDWLKFSGSYFEAGPADFDFYVDSLGGYFYIFSCNAYTPKNGRMNNFLWFNEVARCAITDRMAPGAWRKFCEGGWTEPGLGGRSSKVCMGSYGIYGRVIYSHSLGKYLRIGVSLGVIDKRFTSTGLSDGSIYVSACDDLSRQQWTTPGKLLDRPDNDKFGITLTDGSSRDPFVCDSSLRVYNYWLYNIPSRALDVTLRPGTTPAAVFPRHGSYAYEPLPESGDALVSRQTRIVGCASPENVYGGGVWRLKKDPAYFQGTAMESNDAGAYVQFSFRGTGVYWRGAADTNCGKADIYIDGKLVEAVDCYYRDAIPYQFAFYATGLDPGAAHLFRAVIRADRNPRSAGRLIRHVAFEHAAESYRASAGFSSVAGRNCWQYRRWDGTHFSELRFIDFDTTDARDTPGATARGHRVFANYWSDDDSCRVGNDYQISGRHRAVRTWVSPHDGRIRIEGTACVDSTRGALTRATIMHGHRKTWSSDATGDRRRATHDIRIHVERGDAVNFIAGGPGNGTLIWDPVITYESE